MVDKTETTDQFTNDREGNPSQVTDYKLFYPKDFERIRQPELVFVTAKDYSQPSFRIESGQILADLSLLRKRRIELKAEEHGVVQVHDNKDFYKNRIVMTGKIGIGFQVMPSLPINDYLHTHSIDKGEDPMVVDLFSAFDLMSLGAKGAERYWLVGQSTAWCLVNLYGQKYYHYVKATAWEFAKQENSKLPFDEAVSRLLTYVDKCSFRLYRGDDLRNFSLVG